MFSNLPKILIFTRYYLPGFRAGGPVRSIANLTERLSDEFNFFIVTMDRDKGDLAPYDGILGGAWNKSSRSLIRYLSIENISLGEIAGIINELSPDVIYLNSFFDPVFTQKVLLLQKLRKIGQIPVVIAPRGEFSPGALLVRPLKKKFYIALTRILRLYKGLIWQASSKDELNDIQREIGLSPRIFVARNLTSVNQMDVSCLQKESEGLASVPLRLSFLSRISPKKNLHFALEVLAKVDVKLVFCIYGPIDDAVYWQKCKDIISRLPHSVTVRYEGEVIPENVRSVLALSDIFFFPTLGENYGHVIFEALSAGVPVLISDQTPWHDVMEIDVGWELGLAEKDEFVKVIQEYANSPSSRRATMRKNAATYAARLASDDGSVEMNRKMFEMAIASQYGS